jgi:hypothetical protein
LIVTARKPLGAYSRLTREKQVEIEIIVKELVEDYGLVQYPQSIQRAASALGVELKAYSTLDEGHRELARKASDDAFNITTPDMTTAIVAFEDGAGAMYERLRFSGGHELGHIVLGHEEDYPDREPEADYFSGYFLAPHPLVLRMPRGASVAERFGISASCADFAIDQAHGRRLEGGPWLPHELWLLENAVWRGGGLLGRP